MMLSREGLLELEARLDDRTLGMQATRVLLAMVRCMDKHNECRAGRKDLARMLDMAESNVAKALKLLVDTGFIEKPKLRFSPYTVSPRFAWNSSTDKLRDALKDRGMLDERGFMKAA